MVNALKKLFVVVAFLVVGYLLLMQRQTPASALAPQYAEPYIVIYGRKGDAKTLRLQLALRDGDLRYRYVDVDAEGGAGALEQRMKLAGLEPAGCTLPVVEVNARMRVDPDAKWVTATYHIDHNGRKL